MKADAGDNSTVCHRTRMNHGAPEFEAHPLEDKDEFKSIALFEGQFRHNSDAAGPNIGCSRRSQPVGLVVQNGFGSSESRAFSSIFSGLCHAIMRGLPGESKTVHSGTLLFFGDRAEPQKKRVSVICTMSLGDFDKVYPVRDTSNRHAKRENVCVELGR